MSGLLLIDVGGPNQPLMSDLLRTWSLPVVPLLALSVASALYLRGWTKARVTRPRELPLWRAGCFAGGIASLWIALASPIDALDDYLLTAHMIQHFILMSIAPPLIVLGAPVVPLLRGLPRMIVSIAKPLFRMQWLRLLAGFLTHPVIAWVAMNAAYLGWHVPAAFELTFQSDRIHDFEHLCFFGTSLMFWWVVLQPWPARPRWPRWTMIPYLLTADVLNTVLSASLAFSGRVLYPSYAVAARLSHLTPMQDQVAAGAVMWVLNSLVFLIPAVILTMKLLSPRSPVHHSAEMLENKGLRISRA
jgi:putative membrane protein